MIHKSQILKKESVSSLEKHNELPWGLLTDRTPCFSWLPSELGTDPGVGRRGFRRAGQGRGQSKGEPLPPTYTVQSSSLCEGTDGVTAITEIKNMIKNPTFSSP